MLAYIAVRPPARPSESARIVRHMFGNRARLVRRDPIPRQYTKVINWGNSEFIYQDLEIYNEPNSVVTAVNKSFAFAALKEWNVPIPEVRRNRLEEVPIGTKWLARTTLTGSSGEGIVVLRPGDEIVRASLYVRYVPKRREFRVHVVKDEVIFVQEKRGRLDSNRTRDQNLIRNHGNGWVYTLTNEDSVPENIKAAGVAAVKALGLHFGAADVILGRDDNQPYVLEVNTAPGLRSPTLTAAYRAALTRMIDE